MNTNQFVDLLVFIFEVGIVLTVISAFAGAILSLLEG